MLTYMVHLLCLKQTFSSLPKLAPSLVASISVIRMGRVAPHRQNTLLRELGEDPKMPSRQDPLFLKIQCQGEHPAQLFLLLCLFWKAANPLSDPFSRPKKCQFSTESHQEVIERLAKSQISYLGQNSVREVF